MPEKKFLEQVASYYLDRYDDMSGLTLVFPNKRSAMFMKKYMQEALVKTSARPRFMPRFVTMGNFVARFANRTEMPRNEQLFLLYDCYRTVLKRHGRDEQLRDFDKFIFWGGMILDDFDDIDRQLVDASKLFKNLKDLKEINADYLDDKQKQLVRQIWGETAKTSAVTEFWTHVNNLEGDTPEARFIALWQILGDLYPEFKSALYRRFLDTSGGQFRDAATVIHETDPEEFIGRHYAFVGFNDLSCSETLMLKRLKDIGVADFFWDFNSALLDLIGDSRLKSQLKALQKAFPMPDDFDFVRCNDLPEIEIIAVPSAIGQAKYVSDMLEDWNKKGFISSANAIDTAIVLPDENLLTPVLLSIPEDIPAVNITMGVPFASTAFASMLHSIISMQMRAREIRGIVYYYYADVLELLSHPHIQVIAPDSAEDIKKSIADNNQFNLDAEWLCSRYPQLAYLFEPVKGNNDPTEICRFMIRLIDGLSEALSANGKPSQGGLPEIEMLDYFRTALENINSLIDSYDITMSENTYFALFEKLMQSRRIDLQGTPLRGLQVMGVLETRSIDFDNVIILSMNENTFPRKSYMRTMIPNNLRIGYGMSTIDRQDSLYTYYFYRLLSRARRVRLVYDSRTGSFGAGEPSRYIAQLNHIAPKGCVKYKSLSFTSDFSAPTPIRIPKDEKVLGHLRRFMAGGNGFISASALKDYKKCRLRFYLKYVRNLRGENNIEDYISPSVYGTIVHNIVEKLYSRYEGQEITSDIISGFLEDDAALDEIIAHTVAKHYYRNNSYSSYDQLPAEGALTCSIIGHYVRKMLEIEKAQCAEIPFSFIKGEMKVQSPPQWRISDSLSINFTMSIDRVDKLRDGRLRFIDYKTGGDKVSSISVEDLFKRESHDNDAVFQLMTYCIAYSDMVDSSSGILPVVYPFRVMAAKSEIPQIEIDKKVISDYREVEDEFRAGLTDMIMEIFSPECDFDQAENPDSCTFCPFLDMCGRTEPERY